MWHIFQKLTNWIFFFFWIKYFLRPHPSLFSHRTDRLSTRNVCLSICPSLFALLSLFSVSLSLCLSASLSLLLWLFCLQIFYEYVFVSVFLYDRYIFFISVCASVNLVVCSLCLSVFVLPYPLVCKLVYLNLHVLIMGFWLFACLLLFFSFCLTALW